MHHRNSRVGIGHCRVEARGDIWVIVMVWANKRLSSQGLVPMAGLGGGGAGILSGLATGA